MKVMLLGFTIPDEMYAQIVKNDPVLPAQTHNFSWAIVDSLKSVSNCDVSLLSVAPVTDWPRNPKAFWGRSRFVQQGTEGELLPFVNLPVLKHLTRFLSCLRYGHPALRKRRPAVLLVHGVHSPFLWFAVLVRRLRLVTVVVLLTDPPGVVRSDDGALRRLLKALDVRAVRRALAHADGVVALTEALARDFARRRPALVMEGIAPSSLNVAEKAEEGRPIIVYAGGLYEAYGVLDLALAVHKSDMDVELRIFGKGPAADTVRDISDKDSRIKAPAILSKDALLRQYQEAALLVQPRPIDLSFVPYSFPSKLLEYMASATPVLSTRLPSIPESYEPYLLWIPDAPNGISLALRRALAMTASERHDLGREAREFVLREKSLAVQGQRLASFLDAMRHAG